MEDRWLEVEDRNRLFWKTRLADIEVNLIALLRRDYEPWRRGRMKEEQMVREEEIWDRARSRGRDGRELALYSLDEPRSLYSLDEPGYDMY
jgi:hypothetical protein